MDAMLFLTSHAQNSAFRHILLILWGAPNSGNLQLGIVSLGFGLQIEGGGVSGRLRVGVSGLEGSG